MPIQIIKTLKFSEDSDGYQINAVAVDESAELITVDDIDEICGTIIEDASTSEVEF